MQYVNGYCRHFTITSAQETFNEMAAYCTHVAVTITSVGAQCYPPDSCFFVLFETFWIRYTSRRFTAVFIHLVAGPEAHRFSPLCSAVQLSARHCDVLPSWQRLYSKTAAIFGSLITKILIVRPHDRGRPRVLYTGIRLRHLFPPHFPWSPPSRVNKYQLSPTNPRDALRHGKRAANKVGRSVW